MCGICGVLQLDRDGARVAEGELECSRDAMAARGPDWSGLWMSPRADVGLAHRRLAIIDLSDAGAQPMLSADGRFAIVFNGEIYNYRELRAELEAEGVRFRSKSDTEVLLALYQKRGPGLLRKLRGMYAFGIWDDSERRLFLARDPYGIKPLYYSVHGGLLRFASQVKALEAGGAIPPTLDPAGLVGFLLWGTVPEPHTLRREILALPAGHFLEIVDGRVRRPQPHHHLGDGSAAAESDVVAALEDSVRAHLVSDVPVGIFLSAGLDSAMLAAVMRRHLSEPPLAFTLAFDEFLNTPLDEGPGAAAVAQALGLRHVEKRVGRSELEGLWAKSLEAMDQPSIDGFNVFLVSHYAREAGLKVVLSGLGGDELFGSYPSFRDVPTWRKRAAIGRAIPGLLAVWERGVSRLGARWPKAPGFLRHGQTLPGAYFLRRGLFLPEEIATLIDPRVAEEGLSSYDAKIDAAKTLQDQDLQDDWTAVHLMESTQYLRNQLLRDADWASMAHSLELRVPFVDVDLHRAFWAAKFEPARSCGKAAIVRAAAPEIPEHFLRRLKSGFMVPWAGRPSAGGANSFAWGHQARVLAREVLGAFGVETHSVDQRSAARVGQTRSGGTLFLMTEAFRRAGGIQTYNRTQIQALRECAPADPVSVLALNDRPTDVLRAEWVGLLAEGHSRHKIAFSLRALGLARAGRPRRIILGHRNLLPLAPLLRLAAPASERWLLTYGIETKPRVGFLERRLLPFVERLFAISPQTADAVRLAGFRRAPELWPCSLPHFWEMPDPSPPAFGRPVRLLTVSRLAPTDRYKGIDVCIRAVALLLARGVAVTLDVVGDGSDLGRLRRFVKSTGVESAVFFRGRTDDGSLRSLYAACDVFVLPSAGEGFGIVYLEAMAFAKPVIAADAGGAPYVVRPGVSGVLVPHGDAAKLADAVSALVDDPEAARLLGLRGRGLLAETFSFARMVDRTGTIVGDHPAPTRPEPARS